MNEEAEKETQTILEIGRVLLFPDNAGCSAVCICSLFNTFEVRIAISEDALKEFDRARLAQKRQQLEIVHTLP